MKEFLKHFLLYFIPIVLGVFTVLLIALPVGYLLFFVFNLFLSEPFACLIAFATSVLIGLCSTIALEDLGYNKKLYNFIKNKLY